MILSHFLAFIAVAPDAPLSLMPSAGLLPQAASAAAVRSGPVAFDARHRLKVRMDRTVLPVRRG